MTRDEELLHMLNTRASAEQLEDLARAAAKHFARRDAEALQDIERRIAQLIVRAEEDCPQAAVFFFLRTQIKAYLGELAKHLGLESHAKELSAHHLSILKALSQRPSGEYELCAQLCDNTRANILLLNQGLTSNALDDLAKKGLVEFGSETKEQGRIFCLTQLGQDLCDQCYIG